MIKGTFHKACSCWMCMRGRGRSYGQFIQNQNERKLRRKSKVALAKVVKGVEDDAVIAPIASPYTD